MSIVTLGRLDMPTIGDMTIYGRRMDLQGDSIVLQGDAYLWIRASSYKIAVRDRYGSSLGSLVIE